MTVTFSQIVLKNVQGSEFLVSVLEFKQIGLEEANDEGKQRHINDEGKIATRGASVSLPRADLPLTQDAFVGLW